MARVRTSAPRAMSGMSPVRGEGSGAPGSCSPWFEHALQVRGRPHRHATVLRHLEAAAVLCDGAAKLVDEAPGGWSPKSGAAAWKGVDLAVDDARFPEQLSQRQHAARPGRPSGAGRLHARGGPGAWSGCRPRQGARTRSACRIPTSLRHRFSTPPSLLLGNHMVTSPAAIEPETSPSINHCR
jgi:hypothetical protein